jgi:phytoene desaturase
MPAPRRRVIVIGAGLGGLATAIHLLRQDLDVTVLERQPGIGGRAARLTGEGYTFDVGPAMITMPSALERLFAAAGGRFGTRVKLQRLEPSLRISWTGEARRLSFESDRTSMREAIAQFSRHDAEQYDAFWEAARELRERELGADREGAPPSVAGQVSRLDQRARTGLPRFLTAAPRAVGLGRGQTADAFLARFFEEPRVRQAFGAHSLLVGADPDRAPATLATLAYVALDQGVWYAPGGFGSVVEELGQLVRKGGGVTATTRRVTRILVTGGRARGVRTDHAEEVFADAVVSDADVAATQVELLGGREPNLRPGAGCFLLFLGLRRGYPELQHHNLLFGPGLARIMEGIGGGQRASRELWLYLHAASRTDPGMARERGESMVVVLPVPNLRTRIEWGVASDQLRERVLDVLESPEGLGLPGLRQHLAFEARWTPLDFRDRLGTWEGSGFGPEVAGGDPAQAWVPRRDRRVRGLYHAGAGTPPGPGVVNVLIGAEQTAGLVARDLASSLI